MRITSTILPSSSSSRTVWATRRSTIPPTKPSVCQRDSPPSMRSCAVSANGSAKARIAVSKLIPCLLRLLAALSGSHSNRVCNRNLAAAEKLSDLASQVRQLKGSSLHLEFDNFHRQLLDEADNDLLNRGRDAHY